MKAFNWDPRKNQQLIEERQVSFEDILFYLQQGCLLDDIEHPNKNKYPNQKVFVINIDGYVHMVPYVESDEEIFLKTIIPSRKATKLYFGDQS